MAQQTTQQAPAKTGTPAWVAPVAIVAIVITLIAVGRKKDEAVENPLVDLAVITVGVFAYAAVFRFLLTKLGAPGGAAFFGGQPAADAN